jgi:hypothetical protein
MTVCRCSGLTCKCRPPERDYVARPDYKYREGEILRDLGDRVDKSYGAHYIADGIQAFDAWIALGDSTPTFRNIALKYLWRYGKKNGSDREDLFKAMHYILMCLYVDFYRDRGE